MAGKNLFAIVTATLAFLVVVGCSSADGTTNDAQSTATDGGADGDTEAGSNAGGCGAGTEFCNSACGICILVGSACHIDTCGNGDGGQPCGRGRCGAGTQCVNQVCVPGQ
jgi:hypothetical protein